MENFNNYTGRARDARSKNKLLGLWRYAMVLVVGLLLITPYSFSQSITSFSQYANKNKEWIPGILQSSKSDYYEGSSTLQRLVFVGIPTAQNNQYELKFKVLATKGGINAYDFVTGYDQAFKDFYNMTDREIIADIATNNPFDPSDPNDMLLLVKSYAIPQPASEEIIDALYKSTHKVIASSPSAASYTNAGRSDVGAAVNYYDVGSYPRLTSNPRGVQLYGNAPISEAQLIFDGYSGVEPNTGDNYGLYTLRWTSQSTNLMVLMAGHLSIGNYEPYAPLNYGAGKGSSSISGGPYHFKLETLNGASLGNQDNQIQSGAIMPPPLCDLPPAGPVCVGEITEHTVTATSGASYKWTVSGNGELVNNATPPVILSSPYTSSSNSIRVRATGGGSYTITVEISASGRTRTCSETVTVYANPDLDDYETDYCEDDFESMDLADFNESIGAATDDDVVWYSDSDRTNVVTTTGNLAVGEHNFYATVTNPNECSSNAMLTITILEAPELTAQVADYCEDDFESLTLADFNESIGAETGDNVVWKDSEGNTVTETGELAVGEHTFTATVTRPYANTDSESCDSEITLTITILEAPELTAQVADYCEDDFESLTLADFNESIGAETGDNVVWKDSEGNTVTETGELAVGEHTFTATVTRPYANTDSESCDSETTLTITILEAPDLTNHEVDYCEDEMKGVLLSSFNESIGAGEDDVVVWYSDADRTEVITEFESLMIGEHTFYATVTRAYAETNSESCDSEATLTVNVKACSRIQLTKLTDGQVDETKDWNFKLYEVVNGSDELIADESTLGDDDGVLFDGESIVLSRYKIYKICETNVGVGFKVYIKYKDGENWINVPVFNPDAGDGSFESGEALGNYCFYIGGEDGLELPPNTFGSSDIAYLVIEINNETPPGGDARTPGYWKNWSSCSGGKQFDNVVYARANGGEKADFWLLDDYVGNALGEPNKTHTMWSTSSASFVLTSCDQAVLILDERQNGGKFAKLANDAAYKLAKHLLTYQLNKLSGTYDCASAAAAATAAEALLAKINFRGTLSSYLSNKGKANADYTAALSYAKILDAYNNNLACDASMTATSTSTLQGLDLAEVNQLRAYPTPFTDKAKIEFTVAQDENFSMRLYDMRGALVRELKSGEAKAGMVNTVEVDGGGLPEGLYIARMVSDSGTKTVKLLKKE